MFILRKITTQGVRMHFSLGKSFTIVTESDSLEEFKKSLSGNDPKETYAFISDENGKVLNLYRNQDNHILTENGSVYDNVSFGPH